jgi:hypothetical protein
MRARSVTSNSCTTVPWLGQTCGQSNWMVVPRVPGIRGYLVAEEDWHRWIASFRVDPKPSYLPAANDEVEKANAIIDAALARRTG